MTAAPASSVERYRELRAATCALAEPLSEADAQVQSMPDASPVKWHLAHTTWFFETFVLEPHEPGFRPHHPAYRVLFNSYYNGIGEQHARPQRGLITRPGLAAVMAYRRAIDERIARFLARHPPGEALEMLALGLHHEQQHQELILTDVLHLLSCNPLRPAYRAPPAALPRARRVPAAPPRRPTPLEWIAFDGGRVEIGHRGPGFAFDNECPRHARLLAPYALAQRLVTQGEWLAFIDDGGYADPRWWLSAGWDWVRAQRVEAPLYWQRDTGQGWQVFALEGLAALDADAPVLHLSLYEADAYARWHAAHGATPSRLPTEAEWEAAAAALDATALQEGNLAEDRMLRALPARAGQGLRQMFGDAWEWTRSAYEPYPGYRPWAGAAGEYNAKFMLDQQVLRGGSFATPRSHLRPSYRNFFPAATRWQFTGLRLARDLA